MAPKCNVRLWYFARFHSIVAKSASYSVPSHFRPFSEYWQLTVVRPAEQSSECKLKQLTRQIHICNVHRSLNDPFPPKSSSADGDGSRAALCGWALSWAQMDHCNYRSRELLVVGVTKYCWRYKINIQWHCCSLVRTWHDRTVGLSVI